MKYQPISTLVEPVRQIGPTGQPEELFPYVDISSVDRVTKTIVGVTRMRIADAPSRAKQNVASDDVLVSTVRPNLNTTARVMAWQSGAIASTGFCVLRARKADLDPDYLFYFTQSPGFVAHLTRIANGASYPAVTDDDIRAVGIPYPPLPEQQSIALRLQVADGLRRTRRHALQLCDEWLPAAFLEMFGRPTTAWPTVSVEELAANEPNSIRTGPFGSQLLHSEFTSTGVAVLGIDNAVNNRFEWAERRYISPQKYAQLKRYTVRPGDVIITIMGTCGRCAVVPSDIPLAINTKHLCCLTLDRTRALPEFLHAAFLFQPSIRRQLGASQKGAIMDGLNMEIIKGLTLPLPPIHLQRIFVALVQEQSGLRAAHVEALRQADHLFQTLLHEAFVQ